MAKWTAADMPALTGRAFVVTGTGGLGYEDAAALAKVGAEVILAGRNAAGGAEAVARINAVVPGAAVRFAMLDLSDLASVRRFCDRLASERDTLDGLINNAGVMNPPKRMETVDGFELQLGTNYLGHFLLTAGLLPLLKRGKDPRVVTLSSVAARQGNIQFDDLNFGETYAPMKAYAQSKIACLMFALELQKRSDAGNWGIASLAAHPGVSRTNLLLNTPGGAGAAGVARKLLAFLFQPVWQGALPTLFAATAPDAKPGGYYGPGGFGEIRGYPAEARIPEPAQNPQTLSRLWAESERLTGARFA
jgi:NAD(P)-dependent dehydrogenase (short-subunit alcohol dehydrogenase family)